MTAALAVPRAAQAACTWTPSLTMAPKSGAESHGFTLNWSKVPTTGDCALISIHHYRVVLLEGSSYATSATGPGVYLEGPGGKAEDYMPHRADRDYTAVVYACKGASCAIRFGMGAGETIATGAAQDEKAAESTAQEEWVLRGVESDDPGIQVVPANTNDPSMIRYPDGYGANGKFGLYYFDKRSDDLAIKLTQIDRSEFANLNTLLAADWSAPVEVAGSNTTLPDYSNVSHPYAFPVGIGANKFVRLLAQNQSSSANHVVWADSADPSGTDFDLVDATGDDCLGADSFECDWSAATGAATAGIAICTDGSSGCDLFDDALHGRWLWDYVANGAPDLSSDSPMIVFSGKPADPACQVETAVGDVFYATWNPALPGGWDVPVDGGGCPIAVVPDAHDPAMFPLPGGQFALYVMMASDPAVPIVPEARTYYYDGSAWEASSAVPRFLWDQSPETEITHDCIANMDVFANIEPGVLDVGMLLYVHQSLAPFENGFDCTVGHDQPVSSPAEAKALYFAELTN